MAEVEDGPSFLVQLQQLRHMRNLLAEMEVLRDVQTSWLEQLDGEHNVMPR